VTLPQRKALKVLMLGPANVIHTQRWAEGLSQRGVHIVLASQHRPGAWKPPAAVKLAMLPHPGAPGYFLNVPAVKALIAREQPDLLHTHYASGYGTTAALSNFEPSLLSVWGSDVFDFPKEGALKGWWLRRNLRRASVVASTSEVMAQQVRKLVPDIGPVPVTPFGVDTDLFTPFAPSAQEQHANTPVTIGTVKTLAAKYGIDLLLRAFAALPISQNNRLLIVGDGPQRGELESLAASLGLGERVHFAGAVPHADVPHWLRKLDVYVAASRHDSESFGVAVLEASACGLPVVVSDAGGLPEVVLPDRTGLVVPRENVAALAGALQRLLEAPALRQQLGAEGRQHVLAHYGWAQSIDRMLQVYSDVMAKTPRS
jgi:L-malate glycosyltransferase